MKIHNFPVKCWSCEKLYHSGEGKLYDVQLCWKCWHGNTYYTKDGGYFISTKSVNFVLDGKKMNTFDELKIKDDIDK
tara:strand:- start:1708 stop:1938 length:231 start_codon:yes stop_codon:yes gene_type:complete